MDNVLKAWVEEVGVHRPATEMNFVVPPLNNRWLDWQTLIYQRKTRGQLLALKAIGLTGGRVFANPDLPSLRDAAVVDELLERHLTFYVENMTTDY